ncbi:tyrosine-type recombinase/integrase [Persephonella sp.]|uniref:tyrosine-type recombinase/integrase n=1 Tax=Persephonella sp. TaxID=2060922 RepID=UPI0025E4AB16|nr:tyrosine-type recombinase/integrase [Persephonella sp.]
MATAFLSRGGYFLIEKKEGKGLVKNLYKTDYTSGKNYYYIKTNRITLEKLEEYLGYEKIDKSCYLFELQKELKNSNFSQTTKKTYFSVNLSFLRAVNKTPSEITQKDIERFLSILKRRGKSESTLGVTYSALKYFYHNLLKKIDFNSIKRPTSKLPISGTLSRQEIKKILENIKNIKHRLLIEVAYSCGLKLQETVRIKVEDIDFKNGALTVRKNFRKVPIPESLARKLETFKKDRKKGYIFFSDGNKKKHLTPRSAEEIFKKALKNAGINRNLSFKSLRDSFVAHMLEKKVDPEIIRKIIGVKKNQFESKYKLYFKSFNDLPDLLDFKDLS